MSFYNCYSQVIHRTTNELFTYIFKKTKQKLFSTDDDYCHDWQEKCSAKCAGKEQEWLTTCRMRLYIMLITHNALFSNRTQALLGPYRRNINFCLRHGSHLGKIGIIFRIFLATQALLKCDPFLRVPRKILQIPQNEQKDQRRRSVWVGHDKF